MRLSIEQGSIQAESLASEDVSYFALGAKAGGFAALYAACGSPAFAGTPYPASVWIASLLLGGFLAILSAIDVEFQRLPNLLTLPLALAGLLLCAYFHWDNVWFRLLAALISYLFLFGVSMLYERIRGRQGLGLGDAKLLAASGAWIGFDGIPAVLFIASMAALCCVLLAHGLGKRLTFATRIPFGPFLAFGTWVVWLYGPLI